MLHHIISEVFKPLHLDVRVTASLEIHLST